MLTGRPCGPLPQVPVEMPNHSAVTVTCSGTVTVTPHHQGLARAGPIAGHTAIPAGHGGFPVDGGDESHFRRDHRVLGTSDVGPA